MRVIFAAALMAAVLWAQDPVKTLTLTEAEQIATANSPRLGSANLITAAAEKVVAETRTARYPTLNGALTGTGAETGTAVSAGALTTSSLSSRGAAGLSMIQLITDFGRTASLTETARLRAAAQGKNAEEIRSLVRLETRTAYYQTLGSESILQVAQASLGQRRTTLRQVSALAESLLKSTLDVRFAEVAVSEAELALYQAENDLHANRARLSAAMGFDHEQMFRLVEDPLPGVLETRPDSAIGAALRDRPDLQALGLNRDAAAGVNVSIPILNGGFYSARQAEAELRAQAAVKDVRAMALAISRDVQIAWLNANTAFRSLDVTSRLVAQANEALRLAQARYDNGLSGILELTQAQFSQTSAQIGAASAKFEYLARRAVLDYQTGALH